VKNREDWLCEQLDNGNLSESFKNKYEAELDAIATSHTKSQIKMKENEATRRLKVAELRAKILANNADFIMTFGKEEFGSDYEVVQEGSCFVLYSKVARDDQEHRRVHNTLEEASADLRYLLYNRLYDRYIRPGDLDNLAELIP